MSITATCGNCHQSWAVVPGALKAHPGARTPTERVRVADDDSGALHWVDTSRWVPAGPSATLTRDGNLLTWACLCGSPMAYETNPMVLVPCRHLAGVSGLCRVAEDRANPPHDFYSNPRHGGACPCCGHQGNHLVSAPEDAPCYTPVVAPPVPN